jgi:CTD nuclear envelope phosphatase 1
MNSLNIISARVIGTPNQTPTQSRSTSYGDLSKANVRSVDSNRTSNETDDSASVATYSEKPVIAQGIIAEEEEDSNNNDNIRVDEKTPLLGQQGHNNRYGTPRQTKWLSVPRYIFDTFVESIRWILSTIAAPGVYIISWFYNERGDFAPFQPIRRISRIFSGKSLREPTTFAVSVDGSAESHSKSTRNSHNTSSRRSPLVDSNSSTVSTDSELDQGQDNIFGQDDARPLPARSKSSTSSQDDAPPTRRSIRIKLYNEDGQKSRKSKKAQSSSGDSNSPINDNQNPITPATLKSPTSPASSLRMTKYPRAPAPPRPLIPKRQPSYAFPNPSSPRLAQKTLILDLDETLIHSLSKGGRMSTGHMVEVKLNAPVGLGGGVAIGPQHPILYYVHKRPHCDEFLRKVRESCLSWPSF